MFAGLFGSSVGIDLAWAGQQSLPTVTLTNEDDQKEKLYLFSSDDTVGGTVTITLPDQVKKFDHNGIKAELIGQIQLAYDRGNHYIFVSMQKELAPAGYLNETSSYEFEFAQSEKQYETYNGINVILRYFVRIRISRSYASNIMKEFDFVVQKLQEPPEVNAELKMEVGIEDCLHIEFEYDKSKYHLADVIAGKIYFLLVRIKIKHMEMQILKRESTGSGPNLYNETEVITKFEIMDGAPIKGECIPIRLFLAPFNLTSTYRTIHNKFSVKYYLNLVLVDEEDRRYFKQQEITLWRKELKHDFDPFGPEIVG